MSTREPLYDTAIAAGRGLFGALRLRRITTGTEHVPATGGTVIAMTHFGYWEFALVEWVTWLAARRRIRFMAKQSVFEKPVLGAVMRGMKHIAVDMNAGAAAYACRPMESRHPQPAQPAAQYSPRWRPRSGRNRGWVRERAREPGSPGDCRRRAASTPARSTGLLRPLSPVPTVALADSLHRGI